MPANPPSRREFLSLLTCSAAALSLPACVVAEPDSATRKPRYVMDLSRSKHANLRTLPLDAVTIGPGFWGSRVSTNRSSCLPAVLHQEVQNGRVLNFQREHGVNPATLSTDLHSLRQGADSEVYKWIEAASWALTTPDGNLQRQMSSVIRDVVGAQEPSGYLDTYFVGDRVLTRMLPETQATGHELYSMGHLLQAGIACYRVTGDRTLLEAGLRFLDDYTLTTYGPQPEKKPLLSGHAGPEMALVELFRETGDQRYLTLAGYLLHGDKRIPLRRDEASYIFAGTPFTDRTAMEGHAVRAVYMCCGAADYALETGDPVYRHTLETLWTDMEDRQMYVTGGIGASIHNEAFSGDYMLQNEGSYCESCANIGVALWAQRMLALTGEVRYGDTLERVLYNSVNGGMSLDGVGFNYRNPLLHNPATEPKVRRPFWYVNCCPPNLARTFSSLQSAFYSTANDGIYIHLYDNSEMRWHLDDGTPVTLAQSTNYPWEGRVHLRVAPAHAAKFTLYLRIPAWSAMSLVSINGSSHMTVQPGQYLPLDRTWKTGDTVELTLDMTPRALAADPRVEADRRRTAVQRGPLVYCMEALDQTQPLALDQVSLRLGEHGLLGVKEHFDPGLLGGMVVLDVDGEIGPPAPTRLPNALYQLRSSVSSGKPAIIRLLPYFAFANREETTMQVWLPILQS